MLVFFFKAIELLLHIPVLSLHGLVVELQLEVLILKVVFLLLGFSSMLLEHRYFVLQNSNGSLQLSLFILPAFSLIPYSIFVLPLNVFFILTVLSGQLIYYLLELPLLFLL